MTVVMSNEFARAYADSWRELRKDRQVSREADSANAQAAIGTESMMKEKASQERITATAVQTGMSVAKALVGAAGSASKADFGAEAPKDTAEVASQTGVESELRDSKAATTEPTPERPVEAPAGADAKPSKWDVPSLKEVLAQKPEAKDIAKGLIEEGVGHAADTFDHRAEASDEAAGQQGKVTGEALQQASAGRDTSAEDGVRQVLLEYMSDRARSAAKA